MFVEGVSNVEIMLSHLWQFTKVSSCLGPFSARDIPRYVG